MRALSKYCTRCWPLVPSLNGSLRDRPGAGPHIHVLLTRPSATGRSVRCQTRWKAGLANWAVWAEAAPWATTPPATKAIDSAAKALFLVIEDMDLGFIGLSSF